MTNEQIMQELQCGYAQKRVLPLIMQGLTTMQVAIELGVTESAVKFQLTPLYKQTGFKNRKQLVAGLLARGWVVPPIFITSAVNTASLVDVVFKPGASGFSILPKGSNGSSN